MNELILDAVKHLVTVRNIAGGSWTTMGLMPWECPNCGQIYVAYDPSEARFYFALSDATKLHFNLWTKLCWRNAQKGIQLISSGRTGHDLED
jgi:hypothetical protein